MAVKRRIFGRDGRSGARLRYLGAGLAYAVAVVHLFHPKYGFLRFAKITATGDLSLFLLDPRPLAFVLSGVTIIAGIKLLLLGAPRRPIYALGMGLVGAFLVGFFLWHLSGHGGFLPGREPIYHGAAPLQAVASHLIEYPMARLAKVLEAALLLVLLALFRRE